jgi:hypothetical protein
MKGIAFKIVVVAGRAVVAAFFVAALCAHAAAQSGAGPQAQQTPQPQAAAGAGTITGTTYFNEYFRMSLSVPAGWNFYDAQGRQAIVDNGRHMLNALDKTTQDAFNRSFDQTVNLLTVSKLSQSQSGPDNAIFACGAERLTGTDIRTGVEYLTAMKKLLQYATPPAPLVEEDVSTETVGGVAFGVLTLRYAGPAGAIRQKYWATPKKDYALFCISTYTNDDDRQLMSKAMGTIKFQ